MMWAPRSLSSDTFLSSALSVVTVTKAWPSTRQLSLTWEGRQCGVSGSLQPVDQRLLEVGPAVCGRQASWGVCAPGSENRPMSGLGAGVHGFLNCAPELERRKRSKVSGE